MGMRPYSQDIRDRVIDLSETGYNSVEIAERLQVSRSFAGRVLQRYRETGNRESLQYGGHRKPVLKKAEKQLRAWIEQEPGITLEQLRERCRAELGLDLSIMAYSRHLRRMGLRYKKNAPRQ